MSDYVPSQVYQRIVQFESAATGRSGTAVVVDARGKRFLITAKHLCADSPGELVQLRYAWWAGGQARMYDLTRVGSPLEGGDVAAFALEGSGFQIAGNTGPVPLSEAGMIFTQECFILGYPYGLTFDVTLGGVDLAIPVVKRAIVAGQTRSPRFGDGDWTLLDVVANPGFSGGPVAARIAESDHWQILGIVSGSISGPLNEGSSDRFTTGLSYATAARQAARLIGI